MKKLFFALALIALVAYTRCDADDETCQAIKDKKKCQEKDPGKGGHCCWQKGFTDEPEGCYHYPKELYDTMSEFVKQNKKVYKDLSVDCSASYIKVALLGALLLLF